MRVPFWVSPGWIITLVVVVGWFELIKSQNFPNAQQLTHGIPPIFNVYTHASNF
jgi:hypothetical protein